MIFVVLVLLIISALACIPAFVHSPVREEESRGLLVVSFPSIVVWFGLMRFGYGPQSIGNIVEVPMLIVSAVALTYAKVFVIDVRLQQPKRSTLGLAVILSAAAVLLRALMPGIAE